MTDCCHRGREILIYSNVISIPTNKDLKKKDFNEFLEFKIKKIMQ